MPNWCQVRLAVTGSPADCAEFRTHARGVPPLYAGERRGPEDDVPLNLSFHAQVPVPDEVLAASFPDVDHHWEIEHWGTKWDLSEDAAMDELPDGGVAYTFETAWCPPEAWFVTVAAAYPWLSLELVYSEPSLVFAGSLRAVGGRVVERVEIADDIERVRRLTLEWFGWDPYDDDEDDADEEVGDDPEPDWSQLGLPLDE